MPQKWAWLSEREQVARLNRKLEGWANYFCLGQVHKAYQAWTGTPATGTVSGCAPSTRARAWDTHDTPTSLSTRDWAWYASRGGSAASRVRRREVLSESRVREI